MAHLEHLKQFHEGVDAWNAWREGHPELVPDLREATLLRRNLDGINLEGADLRGTLLTGTSLRNATLKGAKLTRANLSSTRLQDTSFEGAYCQEAQFHGAAGYGVDFRRAMLPLANLAAAHLRAASFGGASLQEATLTGAFLSDSDLSEVYALKATLSGSILDNTHLSGIYLRDARFQDVIGIPTKLPRWQALQQGHTLVDLAIDYGSKASSAARSALLQACGQVLDELGFAPEETWAAQDDAIVLRYWSRAPIRPARPPLARLRLALASWQENNPAEAPTPLHEALEHFVDELRKAQPTAFRFGALHIHAAPDGSFSLTHLPWMPLQPR